MNLENMTFEQKTQMRDKMRELLNSAPALCDCTPEQAAILPTIKACLARLDALLTAGIVS